MKADGKKEKQEKYLLRSKIACSKELVKFLASAMAVWGGQ
jgi:hypothetical protein